MSKYFIEVTNLNFPAGQVDIRYIFEGIQNLERIKEQGRTIAAAEDAEQSVSYSFSPPKVNIPLEWLIINGVNRSQLTIDKSDGKLVDSGIDDQRLKTGDIVNVDASLDLFELSGDKTDRLIDGNQIRVNGSTGNDGTYTISSVDYDSGDDRTEIFVQEDVTDSTADGRIYDGVVTIEEQILWLRTYIFNGTGGTRFRFYGGNFSDADGDGTDEGTPVSIENQRLPENVRNLNAQSANIQMKVGKVV